MQRKLIMKICILDDCLQDARQLKQAVSFLFEKHNLHTEWTLLGHPCQAEEEWKTFDLIFLDVQLAEASGLDLAKKIKEQSPCTPVVLISRYAHYSISGYQTGALRFLPKPVDEKMAASILDDAFFKALENQETIFDLRLYKKPIRLGQIAYVEYEDRKTKCHLQNGGILESSILLKEWLELCQNKPVVQVYKSILVPLASIASIDTDNREILLKNHHKVPFSRHFKKEILKKYQEYLCSTL